MNKPRISIEFCTQCNWMVRAAWMAQEIIQTFNDEIAEVALIPGIGGVFDIKINNEMLFSRKGNGRFPDIKELKIMIRDQISPTKYLGHTETKKV